MPSITLATDQTDQTHLTLYLTSGASTDLVLLTGAWQPTAEDQRVWQGKLQVDAKILSIRVQLRDPLLAPGEIGPS